MGVSMGNSNNKQFDICYGCMYPLPVKQRYCPNCGYDNSVIQNGFDILSEGMILHGRYLVGKVIGRGGFGVTYLGFDLQNRNRLAIKEYFPVEVCTRVNVSRDVAPVTGAQQDYKKGIEGFQKEADTLRLFNSPYIVHVLDFFYEHGTAYIVMEFVSGRNLTGEIEKSGGRMPWQRVMNLVKPLILELNNLHNKNLIHRDIKPDNLVVVRDREDLEHIVLLDFGSARSYASDSSKRFTALITPGYAPIEQYSNVSRQGPYTDVYALCCTIYAALAGVKPPAATERLDRNLDVQSLQSLGVEVPEQIDRTLKHGMSLNSGDRPQTMIELFTEFFPEDSPIVIQSDPNQKDPKSILSETISVNRQNEGLQIPPTMPVVLPDGWQTPYYEAAKEAMVSHTTEGYLKALGLLERVPGWRSADTLAEKCRQKLAAAGVDYQWFDSVYRDAQRKIAEDSYPGYMEAVMLFGQIPGWRDADELKSKFQNLITQRNQIYESGRKMMARNDIQSYQEAVSQFQKIPGWLDANELTAECLNNIKNLSDNSGSQGKKQPEVPIGDRAMDSVIVDHGQEKGNKSRKIWIGIIILLIILILIADYYLRKESSIIYYLYDKVLLKILSSFS